MAERAPADHISHETAAWELAGQIPPPAWPIPWQEVSGDRDGALAWLEYALVRGVLGVAARMPECFQDRLAGRLARLARALDRRRSDAARAFIAQALGTAAGEGRREELVLAAWRHLFLGTLRGAAFERRVDLDDLAAHCEVHVHPDFQRVIDERRGALFVGAHVGAWEAVLALLPRLGFEPFYVVSRPPRNRPLSRYAQAKRERLGVRLIPRHGAVETMSEILAAGGYVALLLDQRARRRTVLAPFFGRPAHCERVPGVLARRLRVPIGFGACYETGKPFRYELRLTRVVWPEEIEHASPAEVAALVNSELERMILARPEQYFWLHERYRKAPGPPEEPED
jgi:KDO2-lipid IV(A) lauroyltransferase